MTYITGDYVKILHEADPKVNDWEKKKHDGATNVNRTYRPCALTNIRNK